MNIFISQLMRGRTEEEILSERRRSVAVIAERLGKTDSNILDTYFSDEYPNMKPLEMLGESIKLLAHADVAIFVGDWEQGRGCLIEHLCAMKYGIDIVYL